MRLRSAKLHSGGNAPLLCVPADLRRQMRDHPDPDAFEHRGEIHRVDAALLGDLAQKIGNTRSHRCREPYDDHPCEDRHRERQLRRIFAKQQRQNAADYRRSRGANHNFHSFPKTRTDRGSDQKAH